MGWRGWLLYTTFCLTFAGAPLRAAQDAAKKEVKRPSRWEQLRARITVKDAEYAGTETCGQSKCHADTVKTWTQLPHSRTVLNAKDWTEDERGCEGCHGPGSEHATDRQHGSIAKLSEHPEYVAVLCNRCHHQDIKANHFLATVHANAKVSCGTCHDVHRDHQSVHLLRGPQAWTQIFGRKKKKPKEQPANQSANPPATEPPHKDRGVFTGFVNPTFLTDREKINALCLSCHPKQRGEFHQNSRHPLIDGRMTCTDCHNPHRSEEMSHLSQRADDACKNCHSDKRGPFIYAHDMTGVSDGCLSCHTPHGSPNNKLTKLNGRGLCLQCHSDISTDPEHQFRPGSCWSAGCHADFHGSQTSRLFIATGARALRSPVLGGSPHQGITSSVGTGPFTSRMRDFSDLAAWLAATPTEQPKSAATEDAHKGLGYEVDAVASYQNLGEEGNLSKYHQYNIKPDGLFSQALGLRLFDKTGYQFGSLRWTGLDEPSQTVTLRWDRLAPTPMTFRYDYDRASFFVEPSLAPRSVSERKDQTFLLRVLPPNKPPELHLVMHNQRVFAPGLSRLTTGGMPGALDYRETSIGPELRAPFWNGSISLQYLHRSFDDHTQFLPDASVNLWQARYDGDIGSRTSLFASASGVYTKQTGLSESRNILYRLGGASALARNLTVSALASIEDIRNPNTANAFVLDNDSFSVRARYRPLARWVVEGGYERVALRRVNNTQTFIDTPRWNSGWLAVRGALAHNVNLSVRNTVRRFDDIPPPANARILANSATMAPLLFDDDDRTDAQLTIVLPRDALLYAHYGRLRRDNDARQVGIALRNMNVGLTMPFSQKLSFNVDWNQQDWRGRGDALTTDPLRLNFGRPLVSEGDSVSAGLSYASGRNIWTTNWYRFTSDGGESVRGQGFWIGCERRLRDGLGARLQFGWDDYDDRFLPGFNNSDSFIRGDLIRRF